MRFFGSLSLCHSAHQPIHRRRMKNPCAASATAPRTTYCLVLIPASAFRLQGAVADAGLRAAFAALRTLDALARMSASSPKLTVTPRSTTALKGSGRWGVLRSEAKEEAQPGDMSRAVHRASMSTARAHLQPAFLLSLPFPAGQVNSRTPAIEFKHQARHALTARPTPPATFDAQPHRNPQATGSSPADSDA